jgi:hypothetical protein
MFLKYSVSLLCLVYMCHAELAKSNITQPDSSRSGCIIQNSYYFYNYLYTTKNHFNLDGTLFRSTNSVPLIIVDNFEKIKWTLLSKSNSSATTFYLENEDRPNLFLCAFGKFDDIFRTRRLVKTLEIDKPSLKLFKNCEWKLRADGKKNLFTIWSVLYSDALYASPYSMKERVEQRNLFLGKSRKVFNKPQFKWWIECPN